MPGRTISNAPKSGSFAVSFVHFKLRRKCKENYVNMKESKVGSELYVASMYSHALEGRV